MGVEIEIRKFKDVDLRKGTIVEAFPSVGLVSTIASSYLISSLRLDQICAIESDDFPAISMIYSKKPKFPARVYARADHKLAVFICEVPLPRRVHRPIARCLLKWAKEQQCNRIVSFEGLPIVDEKLPVSESRLWGVGSTDAARKELENVGIQQLETGMISGVSGVLLNEGRWTNFDVISLLAEARPYIPDALAAAKLVEGLDKLMPNLEIPVEPLYHEAEALQAHLAVLREQARPAMKETVEMYR